MGAEEETRCEGRVEGHERKKRKEVRWNKEKQKGIEWKEGGEGKEGRYITVRGFKGLDWAGPGFEARRTQYQHSKLMPHYGTTGKESVEAALQVSKKKTHTYTHCVSVYLKSKWAESYEAENCCSTVKGVKLFRMLRGWPGISCERGLCQRCSMLNAKFLLPL